MQFSNAGETEYCLLRQKSPFAFKFLVKMYNTIRDQLDQLLSVTLVISAPGLTKLSLLAMLTETPDNGPMATFRAETSAHSIRQ
jgi:hypothetical protein